MLITFPRPIPSAPPSMPKFDAALQATPLGNKLQRLARVSPVHVHAIEKTVDDLLYEFSVDTWSATP